MFGEYFGIIIKPGKMGDYRRKAEESPDSAEQGDQRKLIRETAS